MSDQQTTTQKPISTPPINLQMENRQNKGTGSDFTLVLPTDGKLYNFGPGNPSTGENGLSTKAPVLATHITFNTPKFELSIAPSAGGKGPEKPVKPGVPTEINPGATGATDISKYTVMANQTT